MTEKDDHTIADLIHDETFDMDPEEIRKIGYQMVDLLVEYFKDMRTSAILPNKTLQEMSKLIYEPLPQNEQTADKILDECKKKIMPEMIRIGHPRLLGWILSSGTPVGAFADGVASALNQNVSVSGAGMATAVELLVIDWIKEIIGYDPCAAGLLVSGGSLANLTALTVARNMKANFNVRHCGMKQDRLDKNMVLYVSKEVHVCVPKAANILGIGTDNIRYVNVDHNLRVDTEDLRKKIVEDQKNGLHPFCVVASAGTVNTGAIDPLESIADICKQYDLWFHVDAAYGGFAALSSRLKPLLNGIERADSIAIDPHKWLFIPYEAGCVLVKNSSYMKQTFAMGAEYIHANTSPISNEDVDFSDYGIQLSRNFRALKIWMSLKQYGVLKYGRLIDQNVHLIQYFAALINETTDFETLTDPCLSIICFRFFPTDLQKMYNDSSSIQKEMISEYLNVLNRDIIECMRRDGRILLSSTILGKRFVLRACVVNYRTTKKDIVMILEIVRELGSKSDKKLRKPF
ncbi:MAG: aminotransferase class I/II-fold pyridoxal phosphate-dependent enzyme [Euryarchaeota archaeon]|nr:aminotransferase class I/II-fold pyridoxal phosphate-dependent enzyme [Euryarchaeota archaeon]